MHIFPNFTILLLSGIQHKLQCMLMITRAILCIAVDANIVTIIVLGVNRPWYPQMISQWRLFLSKLSQLMLSLL